VDSAGRREKSDDSDDDVDDDDNRAWLWLADRAENEDAVGKEAPKAISVAIVSRCGVMVVALSKGSSFLNGASIGSTEKMKIILL